MMYILKSIYYLIVGFAVVFATTNGNENLGDESKNREEEVGVRVPVIDLAPWFDQTIVGSSSPRDRKTDEPDFSLGLTEAQRDIVHQIRRACREVGFFQITGGLGSSTNTNGANENYDDDAMIQRTWKASKDFFDLPLDEKLEHTTVDNTKYPYGYEQSETLVRGKLLDGEDGGPSEDDAVVTAVAADLKETFSLGPPDNNGSGMPPRRWIDSPNVNASSSPSGVFQFQTSLEAYYERMEDLALTLLQIFAIALEESPDFFLDKMDHHMSALRLVHYYPLEQHNKNNNNQTTTTTRTSKPSSLPQEQREPIQRVVRAGAHTDYGALTILAAQDEGLEVLLRDTSSSTVHNGGVQQQRWYPVPVISGAFVVNLGDLMQRWTNNEWISTMHRVVMPATEAQERRYSMAYFVNTNGDTRIEPLKCCRGSDDNVHKNGRVITAGEHLMAKHLASMGIVMDDDDKAENVSNNIMEKESCDASE
jgi:isopenicillin N synthase-like dioxygenase